MPRNDGTLGSLAWSVLAGGWKWKAQTGRGMRSSVMLSHPWYECRDKTSRFAVLLLQALRDRVTCKRLVSFCAEPRPQIALSGRDHGEGASSAATAPASLDASQLPGTRTPNLGLRAFQFRACCCRAPVLQSRVPANRSSHTQCRCSCHAPFGDGGPCAETGSSATVGSFGSSTDTQKTGHDPCHFVRF